MENLSACWGWTVLLWLQCRRVTRQNKSPAKNPAEEGHKREENVCFLFLSFTPRVLFHPGSLQTSTPAPQTDLSARTTAAFRCVGCVMATMTAGTMKMSPTPPALVEKQIPFVRIPNLRLPLASLSLCRLFSPHLPP